eukprot:876893-Amphidinium_carterae.1
MKMYQEALRNFLPTFIRCCNMQVLWCEAWHVCLEAAMQNRLSSQKQSLTQSDFKVRETNTFSQVRGGQFPKEQVKRSGPCDTNH